MKKEYYPRPQFKRESWVNLNGQWDFDFDDNHVGLKEKWYEKHTFSQQITVPFVFQSELSGIHDLSDHDHVWYQTYFEVPHHWKDKVVLHFGAVDYESRVYINGHFVGEHIGGHDSFSFDITNYLTKQGKQKLTVYVFDPSHEERIPRGKQTWNGEAHAIWYTKSTGIWQTVWLEHVSHNALDYVKMTPLFDDGEIQFDLYANNDISKEVKISIYDNGTLIVEDKSTMNDYLSKKIKIWQIKIFETNLHHYGKSWTPESPHLYDVVFEVIVDGVTVDLVESYFGMRKVHSENGMTYLNNRPYYFKLVLDQGYFPNSLLTAPSDEDLVKDIVLAKEMGFNGCRKHQKVEEARFMYHADKLGYLIWTELPSTAIYDTYYTPQIVTEWMQIMKRDYNSPSVVAWVPLNESWGVPNIDKDKSQQNYSLALYHLAKSLDSSRFVISNDGWEQTKTDICAIHNYAHGAAHETKKKMLFEESLKTKENILTVYPAHRNIYAQGFQHEGEPILLTEFGGISFNGSDKNGWGYTSVLKESDFLDEYKRLIQAIDDSEVIAGYCYTQLTDVMQEVNGLLKYNREPKTDLQKIKVINDISGFKLAKKLG